MGDLSKLNDAAKIAFLMEALEDAGVALARKGDIPAAARCLQYVREMRGEVEHTEVAP